MAESSKKKIFVSWSKKQSGEVAAILKRRLRFILENVEIFMSQSDINPGERSMRAIEAELDNSSFGILVVTKRNSSEPWLNFEAGALSKAVGTDAQGKPRVVPLLVDLTSGGQLRGPIGQFQAVTATRDGLLSLVQSIGKLVDMEAETVQERFDAVCNEMLTEIASIEEPAGEESAVAAETDRSIPEMLYEALEILRSQKELVHLSWTEAGRIHESQMFEDLNIIRTAAQNEGLVLHPQRPISRKGGGYLVRVMTSHADLESVSEAVDLFTESLAVGLVSEPVRVSLYELDEL